MSDNQRRAKARTWPWNQQGDLMLPPPHQEAIKPPRRNWKPATLRLGPPAQALPLPREIALVIVDILCEEDILNVARLMLVNRAWASVISSDVRGWERRARALGAKRRNAKSTWMATWAQQYMRHCRGCHTQFKHKWSALRYGAFFPDEPCEIGVCWECARGQCQIWTQQGGFEDDSVPWHVRRFLLPEEMRTLRSRCRWSGSSRQDTMKSRHQPWYQPELRYFWMSRQVLAFIKPRVDAEHAALREAYTLCRNPVEVKTFIETLSVEADYDSDDSYTPMPQYFRYLTANNNPLNAERIRTLLQAEEGQKDANLYQDVHQASRAHGICADCSRNHLHIAARDVLYGQKWDSPSETWLERLLLGEQTPKEFIDFVANNLCAGRKQHGGFCHQYTFGCPHKRCRDCCLEPSCDARERRSRVEPGHLDTSDDE